MYFLPLKGDDIVLNRKKLVEAFLEGRPGTEEVVAHLIGLGMSPDLLVGIVARTAHELGVEKGYAEAEGRRLAP